MNGRPVAGVFSRALAGFAIAAASWLAADLVANALGWAVVLDGVRVEPVGSLATLPAQPVLFGALGAFAAVAPCRARFGRARRHRRAPSIAAAVVAALGGLQFAWTCSMFTLAAWSLQRTLADVVMLGGVVATWRRAFGTASPSRRGWCASAALAWTFAFATFGHATCRFAFWLDRWRCTAILEQLAAGASPDLLSRAGRLVHVDHDARRVAFGWPGGITDNWLAVVRDPTGLLARFPVDGHRRDAEVVRVFGGDVVYATAVGDGWYVVRFT